LKVTLYSQADCGLCAEAEGVLRRLQREIHFTLEVVDIESDKGLLDRYWDKVPVVAVDGKEVAEAPIDAGRLRSAIAS
jgi:glutaredoxin